MKALTGIFSQPVYELSDIRKAADTVPLTPKQIREAALTRHLQKDHQTIKTQSAVICALVIVIMALTSIIISTDQSFEQASTHAHPAETASPL